MKPGWHHLVQRFPDARFLWTARQVTIGQPQSAGAISAYAINAVIVLIQQYDDGGWQMYVPAVAGNEIGLTLEAIAALVDPIAHPKILEPAAEKIRNVLFTLATVPTEGARGDDLRALIEPTLQEVVQLLEKGTQP